MDNIYISEMIYEVISDVRIAKLKLSIIKR